MIGRVLRIAGIVLVVALGLVTPMLATSAPSPASADTVIDGCTIVSNPTATDFTNCPGAELLGIRSVGCRSQLREPGRGPFVDCSALAPGCGAVNLTGANFTDANLSDASFYGFLEIHPGQPPVRRRSNSLDAILSGADLSGADLGVGLLQGANLVDADLTGASLVDATLTDANLTNADLTDASLADTDLTDATITGADVTGTVLVPLNQTETATSGSGAVATWPTPTLVGILGVTFGSCTPASGSAFPLGTTTTVTCQVLDDFGNVATGTFQVTVEPFTHVLVPSNGAVLAGAQVLDAWAADAAGITSVVFELSGGTLSDQVIATATPTLFGWLANWNTTTVPNGTYSLQSVATDAAASTESSNAITITVNNQPPTTAVLIPSGGATLSGAKTLLDASASSAASIASVTYEVSGNGLTNQVVATGFPTIYGYLAQWNTTAVPNGTYDLVSVATDTVAESTTSAPVSVTVDNVPLQTQVLVPSGGATVGGNVVLDASAEGPAPITGVTFTATQGSTVVTVGTATPTIYGWIAEWAAGASSSAQPGGEPFPNFQNGTWSIQSVATEVGGTTATSPAIEITLVTLADLQSTSPITTGGGTGPTGCFIPDRYSATYPGSTSVGTVTLTADACSSFFTITTSVGTLSGTVQVASEHLILPNGWSVILNLGITSGTGLFTGTTGVLFFTGGTSASGGSFTGSVSIPNF